MFDKVLKTVEKYNMLSKGDNVICALSGGADSVCLLHILCQMKDIYGINVSAAHFNHGIRGEEAKRDCDFAQNLCKELDVPFFAEEANVPEIARETGEGEEECGRRLRYAFFDRLAKNGEKIATAHNLNDCMETFFLNVARGTSLSGMCGIVPVRNNIIRPIIDCSRTEIEEYCQKNGLCYVTDSTNLSDIYRRNNIRHNLIPLMYELNPNFDSTFLRMKQSNEIDNGYLKKAAEDFVVQSSFEQGYNAELLNSLPVAIKNRALTEILKKQRIPYDNNHICSLGKIIQMGGKISLANNMCAICENNILVFSKEIKKEQHKEFETFFENDRAEIFNKKIELKKECFNNCKKVYSVLSYNTLDYDKINGKLRVRNRRDGDRLCLKHRKCTKTLKKLFNEKGTDIEKRETTVIIADDDGIVFVEGFGVDARVSADEKTVNSIEIIITY